MVALVAAAMMMAQLPSWSFDDPADLKAWEANGHLANVTVEGGALKADAVEWDPFFTCRTLDVPATPWQYVLVRMKADKSGSGELFWTGTTEGPYGGFDAEKRTPFRVVGDGEWHDIAIFPFWHTEGSIRQLRFDVYDGAHFEIDSIAFKAWDQGREPETDTYRWHFKGIAAPWPLIPGETADQFSHPLRLNVADKRWAAVAMQSDRGGVASLLWAGKNRYGLQTQDFAVKGDNRPHVYNLEMGNMPGWDELVVLGIRLPGGTVTVLDSIALGDEPTGPAEPEVTYFGFENGVPRAQRECSLLLQLTNRGGTPATGLTVALEAPQGTRILEEPTKDVPRLEFGDQANLTWRVMAGEPGTEGSPRSYRFRCAFDGSEAPEPLEATLSFLPPMEVVKADYVPEPKPIQTSADVLAYYFPGWESDAKWDCIRRVAPIRKPLLGYYDESKPECVDWQIKWAAENGISCFLVDWYWVKGNQFLTHWFDAYRQARYRDLLKVAIMWANHNPEGSHSPEDWRNVTQEWIDKYFNLPGYYRIDGKPAVFLWDPNLIRHDLGSEGVAKAFAESQEMAKAAGYEGIAFVSMQAPSSDAQVKTLKSEGYVGLTSYHEWGDAGDHAPDPKRWRYEDLVKTTPETWKEKQALAGDLPYYAVVDTGWDARPWHGDRMQVIEGRTPERFEVLLKEAKAFIGEQGRPIVILGPVNEWGEGSYIEPANEYGFGMYEAIRNVFGVGDPAAWPVNIGPADVGRGPYEFPPTKIITTWTFDSDPEGWRGMMNVSNPVCEGGALKFATTSPDPALILQTPELRASDFPKLEIRMQLVGDVEANAGGQLFWSRGGDNATEATSVTFPLVTDGQMHTYTLDLAANPRWRGRIATLRLDPCNTKDVEVRIEEIALKP